MSAPKKGKDLSALKARLAKKAAADAPPPAPAEEPATAAEPVADVPAPGEVAADIPAPGEVAAPEPEPAAAPLDIPPPGQTAPEPTPEPEPEPVAAAAAAAPAAAQGDDPFGGGQAFNPTDGILDDVGEIAPRKQTGLIILVAAAALGVGTGVGWLLHKISDTKKRVDSGSAKGAEMLAEVKKIEEARGKVALGWEDALKKVVEDPTAGAADLTTLKQEKYGEGFNVEALFGWQLASMNPEAIKLVFSLYEQANGLAFDLGYLANYATDNAAALGEAGGPSQFAVYNGKLVAVAGLACPGKAPEGEEPPAEGEEGPPPVKCEEGSGQDPVGIVIKESLDGEEIIVTGGAAVIAAEGPIYQYAIGENPSKNATARFQALAGQVQYRLDTMPKLEKKVLKALEAYGDNPTTDGDNPQPAPSE